MTWRRADRNLEHCAHGVIAAHTDALLRRGLSESSRVSHVGLLVRSSPLSSSHWWWGVRVGAGNTEGFGERLRDTALRKHARIIGERQFRLGDQFVIIG